MIGTQSRFPGTRRALALSGLVFLVVVIAWTVWHRGMSQEAATASLVTASVDTAVTLGLQGIASLPHPLGDMAPARVAMQVGGRTFYVTDFNGPCGRELGTNVEEKALLQLDQDSGPPMHVTQFTVQTMPDLRAMASVTVAFPGFLGRSRTLALAVSIPLPHYKGPLGPELAP
jgi:hypothetical protein